MMLAFKRFLLLILAILLAQPTSQVHLTRLSLLRVARSMDVNFQSRMKRQAITDPQPFPVMNAVLNVPIPTNIGHFPGAGSTPVDKCDRDEILMEDGTCQNLITGGNCGPNEEILLDPDTNMGFCAPRLCPPDRVFVHATQLCHDPQEMGICPPGRELYYTAYGSSVCSCPDGTIEGDDDLDDDVCELILGENIQCLAGQVFWFKDFNSPPECLPDPCKGANLNKKPTDLPFVPSKATGECFQLGQSEGVCPTGLFYTLAIDDLKGECESLEDAGYNIFSSDELEALKKIYGPTISANTGPPLPLLSNNTIESNSSSQLGSAGVPPIATGNGQLNNRINLEPTVGSTTGVIQSGQIASENIAFQSASQNIVTQGATIAAASGVSAINIDATKLDTLPDQNLGVTENQNNIQNNLQSVIPNGGTESSGNLNSANKVQGDTKDVLSNASSPLGLTSNTPVESDLKVSVGQSSQKQKTPIIYVDEEPVSQISGNIYIDEEPVRQISGNIYIDEEPVRQISSSNMNKQLNDGSNANVNAQKTVQNSQLHSETSHSSSNSQHTQVSQNNNFKAVQGNQQNINSLSNRPIQQTQLNTNISPQNENLNLPHQESFTGPSQANKPNVFTSGTSNTQQQIEPQITDVGTNENKVFSNQQDIGNLPQEFNGGHKPQVSVQNNQVVRGQQILSSVGNNQFVANTNQQSSSVANLTPSIPNIPHNSVGSFGQANNQQQNSFESMSSLNPVTGQNTAINLNQNNNQQSQEIFGQQGAVNNQNSIGSSGQTSNQQQNSLEIFEEQGQQNSPESFGFNPNQNLRQSHDIFGRGTPSFGFRFRRHILNDPILSNAKEISIYNVDDNSLTILSRRKRSLYSYATPSNVFESRLLGCKAGAARDINAKCRKKILPAKVPKHRSTRAAPPVPPTPSCPSGQAFNLRRKCVAISTAQQSLMAKNLG